MSVNSDNVNAVNAPKWLNSEFFTKVLHNCEKDESIKVNNFKITPATLKGDNFACVLFRANVEYQNDRAQTLSMSMVMKTESEALAGPNTKADFYSNIYNTEIAMYTVVLPKFHELLRQAGDETVLGPRCLYHATAPHCVIVLEDIVPLGFSMVRGRFLDMEETKLAYLKLAKWHALSYKLNQENPKLFDQFRDDFVKVTVDGFNEFMFTGMEQFIEMLETQASLRKYKPYFEAMQTDLVEKCLAAGREYREQPQADTHYVLCHGDFHCRNMMFKRSAENQLQDVMLLDYQVCYMGASDLEIIYSMIMLLSKEQRLYQIDELIYHYFSNFVDTLKRIGYAGKMPKMLEFRHSMMRHGCFQIQLMVTFLPLWYANVSNDMDITALVGPKEIRKDWYYNKDYLAEMEECLPKLLNWGLLGN